MLSDNNSAYLEQGRSSLQQEGSKSAPYPTKMTKQHVTELNTEGLVQLLCDYDSGMDWMLKLIKQDINSSKEVVYFLNRRAQIEEEYGKQLQKLSLSMRDSAEQGEVKGGTFSQGWDHILTVNSTVGQNRVQFANTLTQISEEMSTASKDAERSRKQLKDAGSKYLRQLRDSQALSDKAKQKFETLKEDLDKGRLQKQIQIRDAHFEELKSMKRMSVSGSLFHRKMSEDDLEHRVNQLYDQFQVQHLAANRQRQDYYCKQLPDLLKSLKDTDDECNLALQALLLKYAASFEETLLKDATQLSPLVDKWPSIKKVISQIDNDKDFRDYFSRLLVAATKIERGDLNVDSHGEIQAKANRIFGESLVALVAREDNQLPMVLAKCLDAIEDNGITQVGIYRASGTSERVQKLKSMFEKDPRKVNLYDQEWQDDIATISSVLKMFFRELPDSLFTNQLYPQLISAAKIDSYKHRLVAIHELVNQLPDAHYITLKKMAFHLRHVVYQSPLNQMDAASVSLIFGPIFVRTGNNVHAGNARSESLKDIHFQCKVVETVIEGCTEIFDTDN